MRGSHSLEYAQSELRCCDELTDGQALPTRGKLHATVEPPDLSETTLTGPLLAEAGTRFEVLRRLPEAQREPLQATTWAMPGRRG